MAEKVLVEKLRDFDPKLLILDPMLPDGGGLPFMEGLRTRQKLFCPLTHAQI
ncbi:MAG: hypothetical protein JW937_03710 [Candidatus Omnitrophica bacterium]|nr:hypothetical protein [Candidatus Omnitrophota bacterium]